MLGERFHAAALQSLFASSALADGLDKRSFEICGIQSVSDKIDKSTIGETFVFTTALTG